MRYIHIVVETKAVGKAKSKKYIEKDCLDEIEVLENFVIPYVNGKSRIFIDGSFVSTADIEKMSIFRSEDNSDTLCDNAREKSNRLSERMASQGVFFGGFCTTLFSAIHQEASDVSKEFFRKAMKNS